MDSPNSTNESVHISHSPKLTFSLFDDSGWVDSNWVMGCTARVWLRAEMDDEGNMRFMADIDFEITRGFCSCLLSMVDGASPDEVLRVKTDDFVVLQCGIFSVKLNG
ncbi:hypothetical protein C1H46_044723 [Malus baccata]|uniref:Fe-S metabolism associated domain-containing protein n=1 Tax=Malus baccata TaxID=106549 RepID=A0A540K691_MALBA|nr:hypothetical protein C1H46_044723 [Malus baccata]